MKQPDTEQYAAGFKALGDETRLKIMLMLNTRPRSVGEIVDLFNLSQPTISRHLAVLKGAGLVKSSRRGQQVIYSIDENVVAERTLEFFSLLDCCRQHLKLTTSKRK